MWTARNAIQACSWMAVVAAWQPPLQFKRASNSRLNHLSSSSYSSEWSVADDWNDLSAENPHNSAPSSVDIFNQDIGQQAARSILPDNHKDDLKEWDPEDVWVNDIIDQFQNPISTSPLYDTKLEEETSNKNFEEQMASEIALLVRCNESPEEMLVRAGRAVPELTEEDKMDVSQLITWKDDLTSNKGHWEATPFFRSAIQTIFDMHATKPEQQEGDSSEEEATMDSKAVSQWMMQSLGEGKIGPHDSRVLKISSKYATYGSGKINLESFQQLYVDALTHMDTGRKLQGSVETLHLRNADHIRQVWRDLNNHGIVSLKEQQWQQAQAQLQAKYGSLQQQTKTLLEKGDSIFMDECEILDYNYEPPLTTQQIAEGYDAKSNKYTRKSSHEQVDLAADNKTPLYLKDGSFVFIDEESCIGCMQCVNVAPDSFLMMESGRARTFNQRDGTDVKEGVAACPVSCMHKVSFDELKELETARDKGDGRSDHQHMGHQRGYTPLHVSRRGSDNNHRSSWYHYMKGKCVSSGQCPQRGCFDCPSFRNPGENPYFQERVKKAQHGRAQHFLDSGAADLWRKTAEM